MQMTVDEIKQEHDAIVAEAKAILEIERSGKRSWWRKNRLERRIAKFRKLLKAANIALDKFPDLPADKSAMKE